LLAQYSVFRQPALHPGAVSQWQAELSKTTTTTIEDRQCRLNTETVDGLIFFMDSSIDSFVL